MYKRLVDAAESTIKKLLEEGYMLHSVTPVYSQSQSGFGQSKLIYHLVKDTTSIYEAPEIKLDFSKNFPLKN